MQCQFVTYDGQSIRDTADGLERRVCDIADDGDASCCFTDSVQDAGRQVVSATKRVNRADVSLAFVDAWGSGVVMCAPSK
jgi:hypothetical protein